MATEQRSAGAIIFYIENKEPYFLLLKYPTYWGFPKGRIEKSKNETEEQAAKREIKEETGFSVSFIPDFKEKQKWYYTAKEDSKKEIIKKFSTYFLAEINKEEKNKIKISEEHEGYAFVPLKDIRNYIRIKQNYLLLRKARNFIKKSKS